MTSSGDWLFWGSRDQVISRGLTPGAVRLLGILDWSFKVVPRWKRQDDVGSLKS